jgi:DNA-binding response OmpR family regulator
MKILLLEPNRLQAQQYQRFLESEGYQVFWSENAQDGIAIADTERPDLIIVELLLAGHSGIEFLYEFRSYADWLDTPVIVLSSVSQTDAGVAEKTLVDLKIGAYLYKSDISLPDISRVVHRLLGAARGAR